MKQFNSSIRNIFCILFCFVLCVSSLCACDTTDEDTRLVKVCEFEEIGMDITEDVINSAQDMLLLQTTNNKLYINNRGTVYVTDANGNIIWQSAILTESDIGDIGDMDTALSHLTVKYQEDSAADKVMNTASQSIEKKQFKVSMDGEKVIIQNIIGEFIGDILLPEAIEKSRFENLIKDISEMDTNFLLRQYMLYTPNDASKIENSEILEKVPNLNKKSFYVLNSGVSKVQQKRLASIFEKINYSKEDLENDRQAAGITIASQGKVFKVVTEFSFENDDLIVNVPCEEIYYPLEYPLIGLDLFSYANYTLEGSEGYYFVPSGSGALFDFDEGKKPFYKLRYYGEDYSNLKYTEDVDYSCCPVYGKSDGDNAFLAIIENGAECMDLNLNYATSGYMMYPSANLLAYKSSILGKGEFNLYSKEIFSGDITIRYVFLKEEEASYSGMANYYRDYLLKNNKMPSKLGNANLPFAIEVINSIQSTEVVAGIKYKTEKVVTDFEKTKEIISEFKKNGVDNLFVKLNGTNENGLFVQAPGTFEISSKAGGKKEYLDIVDYCNKEGISIFNNLNIAFTYDCDKLFSGYSTSKYAARMIDNQSATFYVKEKSSNDNRTDLPTYDVVSPYYYEKYAKSYVTKSDLIGSGISIGELSWLLNSDFSDEHYLLRSETKKNVIDSVETLSKEFSIMSERPNDYLWNYVSIIEKLPTENSGYSYFDASVPFLQMVLHGSILYTTDYWNSVPDNQTALLKAIETGSGISYRFADSIEKADVKNQNSFLYNTNYELWKDTALKNHKYVSRALDGLNNERIVNHQYIDEDFVCVEYSNGIKIYINYSSIEKAADGVIVAAQSYFKK